MGEFPRQHNTGQTSSNCGVWHQDGKQIPEMCLFTAM